MSEEKWTRRGTVEIEVDLGVVSQTPVGDFLRRAMAGVGATPAPRAPVWTCDMCGKLFKNIHMCTEPEAPASELPSVPAASVEGPYKVGDVVGLDPAKVIQPTPEMEAHLRKLLGLGAINEPPARPEDDGAWLVTTADLRATRQGKGLGSGERMGWSGYED